MKDCTHKNKAYSPMGMTLTSYPPINISYWICKDCGFKGEDRQQSHLDTEYDEIDRKFNGGGSTITNIN